MSEQVFQTRYETYRTAVESYLETLFAGSPDWRDLYESMRYSLLAGGKRIRPVLTLEFARLAGLADWKTALPMACALELVHTYSLIHDDLPCMDNDDLRRGKPTNHKVYGECTAVLAGDALQAEAFGTILRCGLPAERRARCAEYLAGAAGVDGICGGQFMDMSADPPSDEAWLTDLQGRKTGSLLSAACAMGAAAAGAGEDKTDLALQYGAALGAAFQIRDDMLDVLSTEVELGKPIGSDEAEGKVTFMSLYGEKKCAEMVERLTARAEELAGELGSDFLAELAARLSHRRS